MYRRAHPMNVHLCIREMSLRTQKYISVHRSRTGSHKYITVITHALQTHTVYTAQCHMLYVPKCTTQPRKACVYACNAVM